MIEKITDWKGNEVKPGMTIYFVQTKPGVLESSRHGLMMSDGGQYWEPEEEWLERKNEDVWILGEPYCVEEKEGVVFLTQQPDEDGYSCSFQFSMAFLFGEKPTIAIKGISDKKE